MLRHVLGGLQGGVLVGGLAFAGGHLLVSACREQRNGELLARSHGITWTCSRILRRTPAIPFRYQQAPRPPGSVPDTLWLAERVLTRVGWPSVLTRVPLGPVLCAGAMTTFHQVPGQSYPMASRSRLTRDDQDANGLAVRQNLVDIQFDQVMRSANLVVSQFDI